MPTIELSEDHKYTVTDVPNSGIKPGVTEILKGVGLIETGFYSEYGTDRGSKVHKATALYDQGVLDEDALDPVLKPYLGTWKAFRRDTGFEPRRIEERFYAQSWGFAGTIDRWGQFQGNDVVLDIKSGSPEPWHRIQLSAYQLLMRENAITCRGRIAVYLSDSGYKIEQFKSNMDERLFLAALAIYQFKANKGK